MELRGASELEAYLAEQRQAGQFESSGRFTVSGAEFFQKFGELSKIHAIRWVFYAAQAAVAMKATRSRLSVSQDTVSITWEVAQAPPWCEDGSALATFSERYVSDPAYELLRSSLLWSLSQRPRFLSLLKEGAEPGFVIECGEQSQKIKPLPARKMSHTQFSLVFEPNNQDRRFRRPKVRSAFHSEAAFRLAYCPMPVFFDGRELSQGRLGNLTRAGSGDDLLSFYQILLERPGGDNLAVAPARHTPAQSYYVGNGPAFRVPTMEALPQVLNFSLASEEEQSISLLESPTEAPPRADELPLTEYPSIRGRQRLSLRLKWECGFSVSGFERIRARAVLGRMRARGNTLLVSHYGLILDPVVMPVQNQQGWVGVIATHKMPCDASGARAVDGPELAHLKNWFQGQAAYWHDQAPDAEKTLTRF